MNVVSMMAKGGKIGLALEKYINFNKAKTPTGKREMRKAIKLCTHTSI